jgi:isoleucyl-tRNA synthetase
VSRIKDVGNPWLDAGIVAFSTLKYRHDRDYWNEWYPADLITESFPGQFRNWFYAVIAESTALTGRPAFRNVYSYALMRDEKGAEMHKSKGNAIWFDDAAEDYGVDAMRWLFATHTPSANLNFGPNITDEIRRRFILPLWNSYSFFVTYARLDGFDPLDAAMASPLAERTMLDRWIISRLNQLVDEVRTSFLAWEPENGAARVEEFVVEELSNWYIRRNRRRFWKSESDRDKFAAYHTLYECLTTLSKVLAPWLPFIAEEMHQNLVRTVDAAAPESVHLCDYPEADVAKIDATLSLEMAAVLEVVRAGRSARTEAGLKVRQPLPGILVYARSPHFLDAVLRHQDQVLDELNVKAVGPLTDLGEVVTYDIKPNLALLGPKYGKRLGDLRQRLLSADPATVAAAVREGRDVEITLADGETVGLAPAEILVDLKKKPGYAAAQGPNSTVVLDTTITPELVAEGIARDVVRGIQDARKEAGFRIEDRIRVRYVAAADTASAIAANASFIAAETLADALEAGEGAADAFAADIETGKDPVRVWLVRS